MMTRDQAIKFMMENPEAKVTHRLFSSDEYLYMIGGICYDEMGYIFDDGTIHHDGLQMRKGGAWETDWDIYNDAVNPEFKIAVTYQIQQSNDIYLKNPEKHRCCGRMLGFDYVGFKVFDSPSKYQAEAAASNFINELESDMMITNDTTKKYFHSMVESIKLKLKNYDSYVFRTYMSDDKHQATKIEVWILNNEQMIKQFTDYKRKLFKNAITLKFKSELERSPHEFKVDDIVMHFKKEKDTSGDPMAYVYKIISLNARDTTDYDRQVIYEALYNSADGVVKIGDHFVRPYDEFMDEVNHDKYPDIKQKYRFEIFQEGRKW